jgi:myo-inositol 2-dehydrogenase/D-chiro-inositol 1-dehydrogenase
VPAKLRVAVVGAGRMGRRHAENLAGSARSRPVLVVDPDPATRPWAEGLDARWAPDLGELTAPDVDAVVVANPTPHHAAAVRAALEAGKPVLCEKPLALELGETAELARLASGSDHYLQVGFMRRYDPAYAAAQRAAAAGELGRLQHLLAISRDPLPPPEEYLAGSGGIFLDLGVHDIDLVRWISGQEVLAVFAQGHPGEDPALAAHGDVEEAQALLRLAGGSTATLLLSRRSLYGYDVRMELWGTAASLRVGYLRGPAVTRGDRTGLHAQAVPGFLERFAEAYRREVEDFVDRVLAGRPSPVTAHDAWRAALVAEACRRSLASGRPEAVPPPP